MSGRLYFMLIPVAHLAVIFDMDGLILDSEPLAMRAWKAAVDECGYQLTDQQGYEMIGLGVAESRVYLRNNVACSGDIHEIETRARAHYVKLIDNEGAPCKKGLWELIEFLEKADIPKGIGTSTLTDLARHKLERAGVLEHFEVVVGGDQVTNGKPAPDIYLLVASQLGTPPGNCVVLEDSGPGMKAAVAAGMKVVLIPDLCKIDPQTLALATATAESLLEAISIIERLAA